MLDRLRITGYAIIDELEIEFRRGLCILSGETGAGKSILIGALGLLLGQKADTSMIRAGEEEATVTGVVSLEGGERAVGWLAEREISEEEGSVIIRRVVRGSGRGSSWIQSVPVTLSDIQEFTGLLFDIHGQHEHQSLLRKATQRELIDRFAGLEEEVAEFRRLFSELSERRSELESLAGSEAEQLRERDMLSFAVREIDGADLEEGEEERLREEIGVLEQSERVYASINDFHEQLSENRGGALSGLRRALGDLQDVVPIVKELKPQLTRLESAFYEIEDITESIREYRSRVDFSPERLETCEGRLAEIHRLEKKYGGTVAEVLAYAEEARGKLDRMENLDDQKERLRREVSELEQRLKSKAEALSGKRSEAAQTLEAEIADHLRHLGMRKSAFSIQLDRRVRSDGRPVYTQYGVDSPEYLISPNEGEPLKPLREIASGGEMSRIMLAIKTVLSASDAIDTMVFDEIDAGIGGEVAVAVGDHLAELANTKQVLCITHLPTIAVRADQHLAIRKLSRGGRTVTEVQEVSGDERVAEVARMLAGDSDTDVSRSHARELLLDAGAFES